MKDPRKHHCRHVDAQHCFHRARAIRLNYIHLFDKIPFKIHMGLKHSVVIHHRDTGTSVNGHFNVLIMWLKDPGEMVWRLERGRPRFMGAETVQYIYQFVHIFTGAVRPY